MKKKENQQSRKRTDDSRERNELNSLNSQLGSFGLEPPKIYRQEQRERYSEAQNKRSRVQQKRSNNAAPKTAQERREIQNKKRRRSKKLRKAMFFAIMGLVTVIVITVLSLTVFFKINTVKIVGNKKYTNKEIVAVLPISKEDNLFIADTKGAKRKLEESLPYIYNAQIKRKIPSTIEVIITETPKYYSVKNSDGTYTLLDDNFKVVDTKAKKKPKGTTAIKKAKLKTAVEGQTVEFENKKIKKNLLVLTAAIRDLELEKITSVYSTDINNNYMVYDKRITYKLGNLENLEKKIYSALATTEKLNESNPDVRGTMTISDGKQIYFTEE